MGALQEATKEGERFEQGRGEESHIEEGQSHIIDEDLKHRLEVMEGRLSARLLCSFYRNMRTSNSKLDGARN